MLFRRKEGGGGRLCCWLGRSKHSRPVPSALRGKGGDGGWRPVDGVVAVALVGADRMGKVPLPAPRRGAAPPRLGPLGLHGGARGAAPPTNDARSAQLHRSLLSPALSLPRARARTNDAPPCPGTSPPHPTTAPAPPRFRTALAPTCCDSKEGENEGGGRM